MLFGCPFGDQACPVLREMVVQGMAGMDDPGQLPRVNQAGFDLGGLGFGARASSSVTRRSGHPFTSCFTPSASEYRKYQTRPRFRRLAIGFLSCLSQGSNQGGGIVASDPVPRLSPKYRQLGVGSTSVAFWIPWRSARAWGSFRLRHAGGIYGLPPLLIQDRIVAGCHLGHRPTWRSGFGILPAERILSTKRREQLKIAASSLMPSIGSMLTGNVRQSLASSGWWSMASAGPGSYTASLRRAAGIRSFILSPLDSGN